MRFPPPFADHPWQYLRRPPYENEEWRLDRLLLRKAKEGVRIYIVLYKEVEAALTIASLYSKMTLRESHPNITVVRHPDHAPGGTLFWAVSSPVVLFFFGEGGEI